MRDIKKTVCSPFGQQNAIKWAVCCKPSEKMALPNWAISSPDDRATARAEGEVMAR